ncbi:ExeM/NucH family extracellular endonuclease [Actinoplanes couchii]|uniref:Multifunctional nuclease/2',3'-cyclic-nucleotide 2'-phosphodiesterase/5'-nucleotidase/3'-nucleotidase n=1 Tax=Actinoplanes couchii TaxID=403638 RepID=A0ABQ3XCK9_9ACTN|nr:ExeM/NucH family extracellular endonuclease [Actinoplanes couchii]MDR6323712.1 5'-nucleotidase [Actinoplanes couchii]GID56228.1 multifunctional nuclease/2',3'-cyclic-nucleotide 2'-phosphodiesterase/5'-nucleotidase/3'-nucleotidase [Actinoplanes couchii]
MATTLCLSFTGPVSAATDAPFISEIHYDNVGTDSGEAIEVEAPVGFDLTGWQLYLYNGDNGNTYTPITTLSGVVPASGVVVTEYAANGIQNGNPDGVALVEPDGTVVEFLSYEGVFEAKNGPAAGQTSVDIGVSEQSSTPVGHSLQKIDGTWTGPAASSFGKLNTGGTTTPEEPEPEEPAPGCDTAATHTIAQVQGTGAATPLAGSVVTVEGVVTADHRTGGYNGIYVQTAGSGGDRPVTAGTASDGIFVYLTSTAANHPSVEIGDVVRVTGTVSEYNTLTQITIGAKTDVKVCSSDAPLPTPVPLTLPLSDEARESAEGMLVAPAGEFTVSEVYNTNRYGEVVLAAGAEPARIPTDVARPGSAAAAEVKADNKARRILVDDGRTTNLADAGLAPAYMTKDAPLRVGDTVEKFGAGVLSYGFSEWRLQPANPAALGTTFTASNPRTSAPVNVGGDIKVASFNVLNYFVHFGGDARGAANEAAKEKQEAKIVSAVTAMDADVVALMEIENSVRFEAVETQLALKTLVGELNAVDGAGVWDYVRSPAELPGAAQQDFITSAIIYKPASVTPKGASKSVNDETVWGNAREPIAQTFTAGSIDFAVVANHFKSKSTSVAPTGDNVDTGDGQGAYNGDRVRQGQALATFVDGLGTDNVVLLGDFNAYTHEDPLQPLYGKGFKDAHATYAPDKAPSYVFSGESGSLDHALISAGLGSRVTGVDIWNINSVESFAFQYDGYGPFYDNGPFRSSDHDPVVVGLSTGTAGPIDLQLLSINDFHGRLESPSTGNGGAAQLVGAVNQLREANPNTAWVSVGDNIGASTFISAIDDDNPTLAALNAGGLNVSAVGNHEFDKGLSDLLGRVSDKAGFPYLAANVYKDGQRVLPGYVVQTVGGINVGYIGVVTEQTGSLVSPDGIKGVEFRDPIAETNTLAAQLSDGDEANGEADVLVLLAHEGAATENISSAEKLAADPVFGEFTKVSAEIDAIFSGHTHQPYAFQVPVPGTNKTRPVIQAEDYGLKLGKAVLTIDPATKSVTSSTAELLNVTGYPANAAVEQIVADAKVKATELGKRELGKITGDIKRAYTAAGAEDRGAESPMGNFIADVQLDQTSDAGRGGAQIALMNPGGLRADLAYGTDGTVTYSAAFAVQPFANDVVTQTLTGAQIKQVLEEQWQPDGASRPVLHLGSSKGLTYSYDVNQPRGSKIIASSLKLNGTVLNPAGTYRVTSNSFLAAGGDNFTTLGLGTNKVTTGDNDLTMLVNYFAKFTPITVDVTPRSTPGTGDSTAPTGTYALNMAAIWPGQSVTLTESALDDDVSDNAKISRVINWGDGSAAQTLAVGTTKATHAYTKAGSFTVTVALTDEAGNKGAGKVTGSPVVVKAQAGAYKLSTKSIWAKQSVNLTVSGVTGATKLAINWGDGTTNTITAKNATVSHTYTKAGTFAVKVTPSNAAGSGKVVAVGSVKVTKDTAKPTVSVTTPKQPAKAASWKTVTGKAADKGLGVATVKVKAIEQRSGAWYYLKAGKWTKAKSKKDAQAKATVQTVTPNAKGVWSAKLGGVARGTLVITYSATDKAGNTSAVRTHTVRITK